jgi:hypothetical protein
MKKNGAGDGEYATLKLVMYRNGQNRDMGFIHEFNAVTSADWHDVGPHGRLSLLSVSFTSLPIKSCMSSFFGLSDGRGMVFCDLHYDPNIRRITVDGDALM